MSLKNGDIEMIDEHLKPISIEQAMSYEAGRMSLFTSFFYRWGDGRWFIRMCERRYRAYLKWLEWNKSDLNL